MHIEKKISLILDKSLCSYIFLFNLLINTKLISDMGKGKKSKTSTAVPTPEPAGAVADQKPDAKQDNSRREQLEETLRKSLVEMELKSSVKNDMASLQFDGSGTTTAIDVKCTDFDALIGDTTRPPNMRADELKSLWRKRISEIEELSGANESALVECQQLITTKHKTLNDIRLSRQETVIQTEMAGKLQEMCKCLQKSVKAVTEERARLEEEDRVRMQMVKAKFQGTVKDIADKLTTEEGQQEAQARENDTLREKMANFRTQATERDKHYEDAIAEKQVETQKVVDGLDALEKSCNDEAARSEELKQSLLQLVMSDGEMKNQVKVYSEKFEQFQDALGKSGTMFKQFDERSKLTKQLIKKLELEKKQLAQSTLDAEQLLARHAALGPRLAEMAEQKTAKEQQCRRLQQEVRELRAAAAVTDGVSGVADVGSPGTPTGPVGSDGGKDDSAHASVGSAATGASVTADVGSSGPFDSPTVTSAAVSSGGDTGAVGSRTTSPSVANPTSTSSSRGGRGSSSSSSAGVGVGLDHTGVGDDEAK